MCNETQCSEPCANCTCQAPVVSVANLLETASNSLADEQFKRVQSILKALFERLQDNGKEPTFKLTLNEMTIEVRLLEMLLKTE
jgi:hypothetical protein